MWSIMPIMSTPGGPSGVYVVRDARCWVSYVRIYTCVGSDEYLLDI